MTVSSRFLSIALSILCLCMTTMTTSSLAENMTPYANLVFESAGVSIGRSMDADFSSGMHCNCTTIYVSSCTLEKKNANGTWSYASSLTPPSETATNTSNFGAYKDYSDSCTPGNTYRIRATFAAVYKGVTYTVNRTSNSVDYK